MALAIRLRLAQGKVILKTSTNRDHFALTTMELIWMGPLKATLFATVSYLFTALVAAHEITATDVKFECPPGLKVIQEDDYKQDREFRCEDSNGKKNGPVRTYNLRTGLLTVSGSYAGDQWDGTWTFFSDGKKTEEGVWKDGRMNGYQRQWQSDGELVKEEFWVGGYQSGLQRTYFGQGKVQTEEFYASSNPPGLAEHSEKMFDDTGTLLFEGHYDSNKVKVGVWNYYWQNGKRRMSEHYARGNNRYPSLVQVDVWDQLENTIDPALLPTSCLPQMDKGGCPWPNSRVFHADTFFDPCHNCIVAVFRAPLSFGELDAILGEVRMDLVSAGYVVAFSGATDRIALLLTSPKRSNNGANEEYYRVRLARDACTSGMTTCTIRVTANLVRAPVVAGKRNDAASLFIDDIRTQKIVDSVSSAVKQSDAEFSRAGNPIRSINPFHLRFF
jgi:antitoxin component YwqK of YwqJK toxin-antitoxin module